MVEKVSPDKAVEALSKYGGTVLKTSVSKEGDAADRASDDLRGQAEAFSRADNVPHANTSPGDNPRIRDLTVSLGWAATTMGYWRAMCMRSSASESWISSPLTSTVTPWIVPVNLNGLA
jgi:hypothetical protein